MRHPNAGGVLVLGLGCENNNMEEFKEVLGKYHDDRVKFLKVQDVDDEIEEAIKLIEQLAEYAEKFERRTAPVSMLKVGLKCGGSDAFQVLLPIPLLERFQICLFSGEVLLFLPKFRRCLEPKTFS